MNYLRLINQFWKLRRSKRITNLQADLYYFLLQECNSRDWENPFQVPNGLICTGIGITEKSLIDARNVLKQIGLIDYKGGITKKLSPAYTIIDYLPKVSNSVGNQGGNEVGNGVGNEGNIFYKQEEAKPNETDDDSKSKEDSYRQKLISERPFLESTAKAWNHTVETITIMINDFLAHQLSRNKTWKDYNDFKSHFFSWGKLNEKYKEFHSKKKSVNEYV